MMFDCTRYYPIASIRICSSDEESSCYSLNAIHSTLFICEHLLDEHFHLMNIPVDDIGCVWTPSIKSRSLLTECLSLSHQDFPLVESENCDSRGSSCERFVAIHVANNLSLLVLSLLAVRTPLCPPANTLLTPPSIVRLNDQLPLAPLLTVGRLSTR